MPQSKTHRYFLEISHIWDDYFDGKLSMVLRDRHLASIRRAYWGLQR